MRKKSTITAQVRPEWEWRTFPLIKSPRSNLLQKQRPEKTTKREVCCTCEVLKAFFCFVLLGILFFPPVREGNTIMSVCSSFSRMQKQNMPQYTKYSWYFSPIYKVPWWGKTNATLIIQSAIDVLHIKRKCNRDCELPKIEDTFLINWRYNIIEQNVWKPSRFCHDLKVWNLSSLPQLLVLINKI